MPWNRVNVDLIGPLTVDAKNGKFLFVANSLYDQLDCSIEH